MRVSIRTLIVIFISLSTLASCSSSAGETGTIDQPERPPEGVSFDLTDITPDLLKFAPRSIRVDGNYAYIASGRDGIFIFDITNPANPEFVKRIECLLSDEIEIHNGYAYVTCKHEGLKVVDIDPIDTAEVVGSIETPFAAWHLTLSGDYAYVSCGNDENGWTGNIVDSVQVIDISDPAQPVIADSLETESRVSDLKVIDNRLYMSRAHREDFVVADITNPVSPRILDSYDVDVSVDFFSISGNTLVTSGGSGTQIYDMGNLAGDPLTSFSSPFRGARDMQIIGNLAFIACADNHQGLMVLDFSDPSNIHEVARFEFPVYPKAHFTLVGDYAYFIDSYMGFRIIDIKDINDMNFVAHFRSIDSCHEIIASGNYVYALNNGALGIIDVTSPESAHIVNLVEITDTQHRILPQTMCFTVADGYAYLMQDRIKVIDVDPPESAHIVHAIDDSFSYYDEMVVYKGYLYVSGDRSDLRIYNVEIPEQASLVNSVNVGSGEIEEIFTFDNYAIIRCFNSLTLIDISDPENAEVITTKNPPYFVRAIDQTTMIAYATDTTDKPFITQISMEPWVVENYLRIIDIDPDSESSIWAFVGDDLDYPDRNLSNILIADSTSWTIELFAPPLALSGGYVFEPFTNFDVYGEYLKIFDVSDPLSPELMGAWEVPGRIKNMDIFGGYAYTSDRETIKIIKLW